MSSSDEFLPRLLNRIQQFMQDAKFVLSSLPNVDMNTAEHSLRQLQAAKSILLDVKDSTLLSQEELLSCVALIDEVLGPLKKYIDNPTQSQSPQASVPDRRSSAEGHAATGRIPYKLDLDRAVLLHDMGNTWGDISSVMGIARKTLYNHLSKNGFSVQRQRLPYSDIDDNRLDELMASMALKHPFTGAVSMRGFLLGSGFNIEINRVRASLRRVDPVGVSMRYTRATHRRVYKVRGSNALWHQDGNEKLKPWGFYVHGCVDGHSRLIVYLVCSNNKRSITVGNCFEKAVSTYGWPSRVRGDYGTENNVIERLMVQKWGAGHRAYLRGRSVHNVRIERMWRDVRKDSLEVFRRIFIQLEEADLLDPDSRIHLVCLYLVYHPRVQASLNETKAGWNNHRIRTAKNKSPIAIYELSKELAINSGYWYVDTGDIQDEVDDLYGVDFDAPQPPSDEVENDPIAPRSDVFENREDEKDNGIVVTDDEDIAEARAILRGMGMDFSKDDGNWGIPSFCEAVLKLTTYYAQGRS